MKTTDGVATMQMMIFSYSQRPNGNALPSRFRPALFLSAFLLLGLTAVVISSAQPVPTPSIGVEVEPAASDPVCYIPMAIDDNPDFEMTGIEVGKSVPDFTLYDVEGEAFNLAAALDAGTPVLLVNGSYTCTNFRRALPAINRVAEEYAGNIQVVIVYTVEAHPIVDTNIYLGRVGYERPNEFAGILYRQPTTYGERKELARTMLDSLEIVPRVVLDAPCNPWHSTYGPAPNMAYLIDTDGRVAARHGWFNRQPHNIDDDIRSLSGEIVDTLQTGGQFVYTPLTTEPVQGVQNSIVYGYSELRNESDHAVRVDVLRNEISLPADWGTALCLDICLDTTVDSTQVILEPGQTQPFTLYVYTGAEDDSARVAIDFINLDDTANSFRHEFHIISSSPSLSVAQSQIPSDEMTGQKLVLIDRLNSQLTVAPNPSSPGGTESESQNPASFQLFGPGGRLRIDSEIGSEVVSFTLESLPHGSYYYVLTSAEGKCQQGKLMY